MFCDHEVKYISDIPSDGRRESVKQLKVPIPDTRAARMYYVGDAYVTTYPTNQRYLSEEVKEFLLEPTVGRMTTGSIRTGSVEELKWYY